MREKLLEKVIERKRILWKKKGCPEVSLPSKGFCEEGRIIVRRDEKGCPQFICISKEKLEEIKKHSEAKKMCPEVWAPVCGEDGRTYSNRCFARIKGVKVVHEGVCKTIIKECAKEGERVNRNPFLGPTNRVCCPGLVEVRVSRSYGVCKKPEDVIQVFEGECKTDEDCPKPKCPGVKPRCVNGRCLVPKCGPAEVLFPKAPGKIVTCCMPGNICVRTNKENCEWGGGRIVDAQSCHPDPCKKTRRVKPKVVPPTPSEEIEESIPPKGEAFEEGAETESTSPEEEQEGSPGLEVVPEIPAQEIEQPPAPPVE